MSEQSALQQLVRTFQEALTALGCEVPDAELERWSIEVHFAMSAGGRWFHTIDHVFAIIEGAEPIQVLAGLFHDTIYLQVDGGLPHRLQARLGDVLNGELSFAHDLMASRVAAIFNVVDGTPLSEVRGLDEYLSALFAARCLAGHVPESVIWPVVACIELTIPFRAPDSKGRGAAESLRDRLDATIPMAAADLTQTIALAQDLANRDVLNFSSDDHGWFLDNTWKLLPESNAGLRDSVYTIGDYTAAVEEMRGFFCFLTAERVFASYEGVPDEATLTSLRDAATINLDIGKRYLDAKVLAANVLGALAQYTGGDAPISLFMGDLPSVHPNTPRIEHYLPPLSPPVDGDPYVYHLLAEGRATDQGFDLRNSPMAAYLYSRLGAKVHTLVDTLVTLPAEVRPAYLLQETAPAVHAIIRATSKLAITRTDLLLRLLDAPQRA